jgi:hypothetical protein
MSGTFTYRGDFVDTAEKKTLPDNPKDALEGYITVQLPKYLHWYEKASTINWKLSSTIQLASIALGLSPAFFTALARVPPFSKWDPYFQFLVVVLPLFGSLCSVFLIQSRMREFHALREEGRIAVEDLIRRARSGFASAKAPDDFTGLHNSLLAEINEIERTQSKRYFTITASQKSPKTGNPKHSGVPK